MIYLFIIGIRNFIVREDIDENTEWDSVCMGNTLYLFNKKKKYLIKKAVELEYWFCDIFMINLFYLKLCLLFQKLK